MKVYTKTGDKGTTALIGGTRVAKNNVRLEAYGGVDELNSHLGMIRSYPIDGESVKQLIEIQNVLFVVGANLATDTTVSNMQKKLPCTDEDVAFLERAIAATAIFRVAGWTAGGIGLSYCPYGLPSGGTPDY